LRGTLPFPFLSPDERALYDMCEGTEVRERQQVVFSIFDLRFRTLRELEYEKGEKETS
jgi:hypothetical protein